MQPVAGDWRSKVKAAKKAAKNAGSDGDLAPSEPGADAPRKEKSSSSSSKKSAAANGKVSKSLRPDLEALATGLPKGWRPMWDKASSSVYYGNVATKVCLFRLHQP